MEPTINEGDMQEIILEAIIEDPKQTYEEVKENGEVVIDTIGINPLIYGLGVETEWEIVVREKDKVED